ncbi:MAG TPA: hypothetical protein VEU11_09765, partial [Terriglobales bacterium]|nr:hypothetical protein [Terriglobales bacterium]
MRKTAISLGLALALGVLQNYGVSQTPAQNLNTTSQSPSPSVASSQSSKADKPAENQDRNWHVRLGPVLMGATYGRFGGPVYYPY